MLQETRGSFYSGTSNIVLPVPNKQFFPPEFKEKSRLTYYASLFNSLEVNSSFYKVPQPSTVKKWAESVPENFRFTFKLWRDLTHNKTISFEPGAIHRFMETISMAEPKNGCLLIQFPPSVAIDMIGLDRFLAEISSSNPSGMWKVAVEFRNRSWYTDEIYQLLSYYKMGIVLHDMPLSNPPMRETESDFIYIRFHGPDGKYRGSYEDNFLYEYAQYINEWIKDGKSVYCYFNNTMGDAVNNLITINKYIKP